MSLLAEYHLYIMIAVLVGLVFLPQQHKKKKPVITVIVLLAFSIGYEVVMGEPVTRMPSQINRMLNDPGPEKSENVKYYKDPSEHM